MYRIFEYFQSPWKSRILPQSLETQAEWRIHQLVREQFAHCYSSERHQTVRSSGTRQHWTSLEKSWWESCSFRLRPELFPYFHHSILFQPTAKQGVRVHEKRHQTRQKLPKTATPGTPIPRIPSARPAPTGPPLRLVVLRFQRRKF